MKYLRFLLIFVFLFPVFLSAARTSTQELRAITALAVSAIARQHYNSAPLNSAKCDLAFQEYLKFLDPEKIYLTEQDVEEFLTVRSKFPKIFSSGQLDFAFAVFERVQSRRKMYCDFAKRSLEKLNLDGNDTIRIDRKDVPREKEVTALYLLWEKKLKNDLILITLSDRAMKQELAERQAKGETKDLPVLPSDTPQTRLIKRLEQINRHFDDMEGIDVAEIFINSIAAAYDPHTAYLSPASDEDFNIDMSLKLSGIGAVLTAEDGYTKVVEIVPGSPSGIDGRLQPGDRITGVAQGDGETVDIVNMPLKKVVRLIRGKSGTSVTLTVLHAKNGGISSVPVKIRLIRAEVVVKDSEASGEIRKMPNGTKIGIITLPSFYMDFQAAHSGDPNYKCASRDVLKILQNFNREGVDGVVMDLRSNGGGSLPDAVALSGLFIPEGPMVQVRSVERVETYDDPDGGDVAYGGPLVVLVNRLSASASEIFAGAIRDYGRGIVAGDAKTHGKGTVQTMTNLDPLIAYLIRQKIKAGSIKLTCAKFYRVNGESTQLHGVRPDIVFPSFFDVMDMGEDKLDNPMPWDSIKPAEYDKTNTLPNNLIPGLKDKSDKRVAENPDFIRLRQNIARFDRIRKNKTMSLNLETRWKEYLDEKKLADEQEKLFQSAGDNKKKKEGKDIYLDEALNILNDLILALPQ